MDAGAELDRATKCETAASSVVGQTHKVLHTNASFFQSFNLLVQYCHLIGQLIDHVLTILQTLLHLDTGSGQHTSAAQQQVRCKLFTGGNDSLPTCVADAYMLGSTAVLTWTKM